MTTRRESVAIDYIDGRLAQALDELEWLPPNETRDQLRHHIGEARNLVSVIEAELEAKSEDQP